MQHKFKAFVTVRIKPGQTSEQTNLRPGTQIVEKEVMASLETEAADLAMDEIMEEFLASGGTPTSISFRCQTVRLEPLCPLDRETADALRREYASTPIRARSGDSPCEDCGGLGFIPDSSLEYLPCRCSTCNRFQDEQEMFGFIFAKLTPFAPENVTPQDAPGSGA